MLTPAQQQLKTIDIRQVMGPHAQDPEFLQKLEELSGQLWQNYLSERVTDELSDEDQDMFAQMASDPSVIQESMMEFLHQRFPDLDEAFEMYGLENKAETILGRIEELKMLSEEDPSLLEDIVKLEQLAEQEDWLSVSEMLSTKFSDKAVG